MEMLNAAMEEPGLSASSPGYVEMATILVKGAMRTGDSERAISLAA